jgi:hypothetical protein
VTLLLSAVIVAWITVFAAQIVRMIAALPFGVILSLFTPFLDISVEAAPPGTWTIRQLPPGMVQGLFHGQTHDDPKVAEEVRQWLATLG